MNKPNSESQSIVLATNTTPQITPNWIDSLLVLLICGTIVAIIGLIGFIYFSKKGKQPPAQVPFKPGVYKSKPDSKLEKDLLRLVDYDRQVANRLVNREKTANPGRTEKWYWEKVLSDLERDRR